MSKDREDIIQRPAAGWNFRRVTAHPGEMLREEFLKPLGLSANELALRTRMPATRVSEIIRERRAVTADTARRLGRFFGTSAELWMNMQSLHDLTKAKMTDKGAIEKDITPLKREAA